MTAERKNIMLGTAGHVDHGKTALVKLLTGCDTDRLAVEKQRGLTIELGFAPCRMSDERVVGIVDVPGHVDFIRNMVAGAHGIDVVILVVAADDGVMPQTREHLAILTLMGARRGIVALTKIDLVDSQTLELATEDVRDLLEGTPLAEAAICPISTVTGEGFDAFFPALDAEVASCRPREATGPFRLWIERTFTMPGFGAVVSGIPPSGRVRVGDRLRVLPGEATCRVRGLEVYGEAADVGRAGECVAINLAGVDRGSLGRGRSLCAGDAFAAVRMAEAELRLLDGLPSGLRDYAEVRFHVGTAEVTANVALLEGGRIEPGGRQFVQLRMSEPLVLALGERFVLRGHVSRPGGGAVTTLGGGRVLGLSDRKLRRRRPWTLQALTERREAIDSPPDLLAAVLKEAGASLPASHLARLTQMEAERAEALADELTARGLIVRLGEGRLMHRNTVAAHAERIVEALEEFHAGNPTRVGMDADDLAARLDADRAELEPAFERLLADGTAIRTGDLVSLAGRGAVLCEEDRRLCERIVRSLAEAALTPPLPADLASALGLGPQRFAELLRLLIDQGTLVQVDPKVVLHREALQSARRVALELFRTHGRFETTEFRDALGVSRRYAVPILDYFDSKRLTVRSGSRRTPGAAARESLSAGAGGDARAEAP